ncbi:MAG: peptidylprolyl isomerase [Opitutales bacterium]
MKSFLFSSLLFLTATGASAQLRQPTLEEAAAKRWSEMHVDRIAADADGTGITLSDVRRQIDPIVGQIRAGAKTDAEFDKAIAAAAEETLKSITERQLVIAEFHASTAKLPASYVDADIEETIRRDFNGDRNRFVASLRASGTTPLAYRKTIEDRIIFEYMVSQIRKAAWDVNPGKIQEYYEKNKADFVRKEQVKLRQITLTQGAAEKPQETAERAAAWADALRHPEKIAATLERFKVSGKKVAGTPTFADVAARISTDDFAGKGGDAGWRNLDDLNETVTARLKTLKVGEISDPLKFDVGAAPNYVIVCREAERAKGYADVNDPEVMTEIEGKVRQVGMKVAIQAWVDDLRSKHHVQLR